MTHTVSETVSDETLNAIIQIESSGNPREKASTSSALGLFQFLKGTWIATVKLHRPDLSGMPSEQLLALRTDPKLCIELGARFTEDNLAMIGRNATGGDLYLAHFLGAGTARKLFRADPATPVSDLVSPEAIAANRSIMQGKTAAQVRAWSARRMRESAGHDWIGRYYAPPPAPKAEPVEVEEEEDIQDTQAEPPVPLPRQRPVTAPVGPEPQPAPAAPAPVVEKETFIEWVKRQGKVIASWFTGGTILTGGLGATTDWRIVAVIVVGILLVGGAAAVFYLATRKAA